MLKQFGSTYLILGTCIAAGMLGLPIVTAQYHFALTSLMLILSWLLMNLGAWCLLQVNMTMPRGANFVSMTEATLGKITIFRLGKIATFLTWFVFLLLLYSLICAYLAASGDLLQTLCHHIHLMIPRWLATILATIILGGIVYQGIRSVDITNRFLMSTKFIICVLLIGSVIPFVNLHRLVPGDWHLNGTAWLAVITSFGYANILPSIRDYLDNDRKKLTRVFIIGSIIPIVLYFVWIAVIQGSLHRFGTSGLVMMNNSPKTISMLMNEITALTHHVMIKTIGVVFISICSITGLLSVATSLMDVLTDGFKREKHGKHRTGIALLAFLPPMFIVIFDPAIFIYALKFAGACCLYVLVALPIAMFLWQKFWRKVAQD